MKYLRVAKNAALLLAVLLLNSLSLASHASAMSVMPHGMSSHEDHLNSSTCATLCRTAVPTEKTVVDEQRDKEDDDELVAPFYTQNNSLSSDGLTERQKLYAAKVKPPPKIPIYVLYGVFRA